MVTHSLIEIANSLAEHDDYQYICARRPWGLDSLCVLVPIADDCQIPAEVTSQGFEYFLEVFTAKEVVEVFEGKSVTPQRVAGLLVFYAENDAYPDEAYD